MRLFATVFQLPLEYVPDFAIDERLAAGEEPSEIQRDLWDALKGWASDYGRRLVVHRRIPVRRRRWIGVVPGTTGQPFSDHCLVMSGHDLMFDPASVQLAPVNILRFVPPKIEDIAYGLSFDKEEHHA